MVVPRHRPLRGHVALRLPDRLRVLVAGGRLPAQLVGDHQRDELVVGRGEGRGSVGDGVGAESAVLDGGPVGRGVGAVGGGELGRHGDLARLVEESVASVLIIFKLIWFFS